MTDFEFIERCASRGMGWPVYEHSAHRPGSRPLPHAWRWRREPGRQLLMVYDGASNREWNPLASEADRRELADRLGLPATPSAEDVRNLTFPDPTHDENP